jgi:exodeoxyribonuclease VII large subunit
LFIYQQRISSAVYEAIVREKGKLALWQKTIELHSPERIFKMGYSLTTVNGNVLKSSKDIQQGEVIETHLADGIVQSVVK